MQTNNLSVRAMRDDDIPLIVDYFLTAEPDFLQIMGVDQAKLPPRAEWLDMLYRNHEQSIEKKSFYYILWQMNDDPIGHSNINKIVWGQEAYMHLHLWRRDIRQHGMGEQFVRMTLPYYFDTFKLEVLYCEPSALNPAPNRTLEKIGFEFVKSYETIPGWINSLQTVNRWCLTKERFMALHEHSSD